MTIEDNKRIEPYFTPLIDRNEKVDRTCAQLCIYSGSMPPYLVTKLLDLTPTHTVEVGAYRKGGFREAVSNV